MRKLIAIAMSTLSVSLLTPCSGTMGQAQNQTNRQILAYYRRLDRINPTDALSQINLALAKEPGNLALQKFRWYLSSRTGRTSEVLASQRRDYSIAPNAALGEYMVWCHFEGEHFNEAFDLAKTVAHDYPKNPDILYLNAWMSYKNMDFKAALQCIEQMAKLETSPRVSGWRALLLGTLGKVREARALFKKDEANFGNNVSWLLSFSLFSRLTDESEDALSSLKKAISITPSSLTERRERGRFLWAISTVPVWSCVAEDMKILRDKDDVPEGDEELFDQVQLICTSSSADATGSERLQKRLESKFKGWRTIFVEYLQHSYDQSTLRRSILANPTQVSSYHSLIPYQTETEAKLTLVSNIRSAYNNFSFIIAIQAALLEKKKKYEQAIALMKRLHEMQPLDMSVAATYYYQVALHHSLGEALGIIDRECQNDSDKLRKLTVKAELLNSCGKKVESAKLAEQLTKDYSQSERVWVTRSRLLSQEKKYEETIRVVTEGLRTASRKRELLLLRGHTYLTLNRFTEALADANRLLEMNDTDGKALYLRGTVYTRLSRLKEAIADFDKVFKGTQNEIGIEWLDDIFLRLDASQEAEALSLCETSIIRRPTQVCDARFSYARNFLMRHERYDAALKIIDECLLKQPENYDYHFSRYQALWHMNKLEDAVSEAKHLCELNPTAELHWLDRANILIALKRRGEALKVLSEGIKQLPNSSQLQNARVSKLGDLLDPKQRLADHFKLLEINPKDSQALTGIIETYRNQKNHQAVIKACQDFQKANPGNTTHEGTAISAMLYLGKTREAFDKSTIVLQHDPKDRRVWWLRLSALFLMDKKKEMEKEAIEAAKHGINLSVAEVSAHCRGKYQDLSLPEYIGIVKEYRSSLEDEKKRLIEKMRRTADIKKRIDLLIKIASLSTTAGKHSEAIDYLSRAISLSPRNFYLYLKRSAAYLAYNKPEKARADREHAFVLYKNSLKVPTPLSTRPVNHH